jgi:uncharacterized protein DUF4124
MLRRTLFTLISFACSVALATTVYKWVDENGVIHYSDQPHPNAQKLELQGAQTYSSRAAAVRAPDAADESTGASANPYKGCAIAQPLDQQNLPNAHSVFIRVVADPVPRGEDRIFISMDGQALNGGLPTGLNFNVSEVDRGEHSLQAQIRDPENQILCQTPTITFSVTQPGLINPGTRGPTATSPRPR